jgi:hypothetical protein
MPKKEFGEIPGSVLPMRLASPGGIAIFLETCYPLCESESYAAVVHIHKIRDSSIADECMTAAISEISMGEGQVSKKVKRHIHVFSAATNDIHRFGRALMSVGIVDRKEGYAG